MDKYRIDRLSNKLPILLAPSAGTETITVLAMVKTGSKYESRAQSGLSHFVEHVFFKGTKRRPTALQLSSELDALGGEYNAFTTKEYTGYYIKASSKHLKDALDLLSDMLIGSQFMAEEIEREKGVIVEEINMYEDNPLMKIEDFFEECLYGDTPAGWDTAGTIKNVKGFKRQDFLDYLNAQYGSKSMTLIIAGKLPKETKKLAEKYFGAIKANRWHDKIRTVEKQSAPAFKLAAKKTDQIVMSLGVRAFPAGHKDEQALKLLSVILGGSMSSRLFSEVRERRGLAYFVRTSAELYTDTGYLATKAGIKAGHEKEAAEAIIREYRRIAEEGVPEKELEKTKEIIRGRIAIQLEASDDLANWYGSQAILRKDYLTPKQFLASISKVTAADIKRVAKKVFVDKGLNLALVGNLSAKQEKELRQALHF